MDIGMLVFVVLFVAMVWGYYMVCKFVASRPGPIHLLAYVMMLFILPVGIAGMLEGGAIRDRRKAERAGDVATIPATSDSSSQ